MSRNEHDELRRPGVEQFLASREARIAGNLETSMRVLTSEPHAAGFQGACSHGSASACSAVSGDDAMLVSKFPANPASRLAKTARHPAGEARRVVLDITLIDVFLFFAAWRCLICAKTSRSSPVERDVVLVSLVYM